VYDERRPLYCGMDFNTNPMSLVVDQVWEEDKLIRVLWEFVQGPTTIDQTISAFRDRFSNHKADVFMYGDATSGMNAQTAQSNWDVVKLSFRGYHIAPTYRLPLANPNIGDRLNAVNRLFQGVGPYNAIVDIDHCPELIRDLREVILTKDGKKIHKVTDMKDPYYFRTHPSDAWGYRVFREFPTVAEVISTMAKKREPMQHGPLMGEVDQGPKARELQRQLLNKKRKPLDRRFQR
jgi:hypothetical protein